MGTTRTVTIIVTVQIVIHIVSMWASSYQVGIQCGFPFLV